MVYNDTQFSWKLEYLEKIKYRCFSKLKTMFFNKEFKSVIKTIELIEWNLIL